MGPRLRLVTGGLDGSPLSVAKERKANELRRLYRLRAIAAGVVELRDSEIAKARAELAALEQIDTPEAG